MILTYIEWRNAAPWWVLAAGPTRVAVDEEGNEYVRWRYVAGERVDDGVWRRSGNITHPHLAAPGPGCERHRGDPHNLCEACWSLEPEPPRGPCPTCGADPAQPPCACTT